MIDIHTHVLPAVDDGADSMIESLAMVKNAENQGVKKMIATPHYLEDEYRLTPAETKKKVKELQNSIDEMNIDVQILPGAEVYITPGLASKVKEKEVITMNDSRYILLEFPNDRIPDFTDSVFYNLKMLGYVPIIAHPERYFPIIENPNHLYKWTKNGIYAQLNGGSLLGIYGIEVQKTAEILIQNKLVQFIGSDGHSSGKRSKSFKKAIEIVRNIAGDYADIIVKNAELLVNDRELIIENPEYIEQDNFMNRFKKLIGFN